MSGADEGGKRMITLVRRYPDSKPEDITDAFSRGVICGMAVWRGTCHDAAIEGEWFECSECGTVKQLIHPHYCPSCGRQVVDE